MYRKVHAIETRAQGIIALEIDIHQRRPTALEPTLNAIINVAMKDETHDTP